MATVQETRANPTAHAERDPQVYHPLDRAFARSVLGITSGIPVVSFAADAANDKRKGMHHLIEAIMGMPTKPFLLTWGRDFPPLLECLAHRHLGNINSEYLMALAYNAADVFAMPSLEEAFGQTALEAIACGTPVAAFAAGGIVDSVRHERTGLVAAVGNSEELRACIMKLLNDRPLWSSCSREGVRVASQEFSMELNAKRYVELYQTLLGQR